METVRDALQSHPFSRAMPGQVQSELATMARMRSWKAGEYLIQEGQTCPGLFLILNGQAEVELHLGTSGTRRLQTLSAGESAGWSWAVEPYQSAFDIRAVQPVTALELPGPELRQLGQANATVGYQVAVGMLQVLAERLRNTRYQIADLY